LVKEASLCGLGKTAPNPVLTTIRYFRDEYIEHVREKYCRAKVCKIGMHRIDQMECILCGVCKQVCAFDAVKETRRNFFIDQDYCTKCKACYYACPVGAVKIIKQRFIRLEEELKISHKEIEEIERRSRMTLNDILKSKPHLIVTIRKDRTIRDAVQTMSEKNVSGIFVVDENNKLVSIFTERDIVRCTFNNISLDEKIENIMRRDITTFDPSVEISSAINVASRKKIRHIPVVEGDKIVGMVTFRDLVSYLLPEICYVAESIY
ncbi:MAG: CBS domain-containing protein, partial [Thermodesulfovibrionales bacterium]